MNFTRATIALWIAVAAFLAGWWWQRAYQAGRVPVSAWVGDWRRHGVVIQAR